MPSEAEVVKILKGSNEYISGEEIALRLNVSRASVWKRIKKLRDMGFNISAVTNKGYQLLSIPDIPSNEVLSSLLNTSIIGRDIRYYSEITSTNDIAIRLGSSGANSGIVVTADRQTAGKARNGGIWPSPPGNNLYMSVLLRPKIILARAAEISNLALKALELAIAKSFKTIQFDREENGLFFSGEKVGGVLCEVHGEIELIHYMAVGIGLNVSHYSKESQAASLLSITGENRSRAQLTASILEEFENLYSKWNRNE